MTSHLKTKKRTFSYRANNKLTEAENLTTRIISDQKFYEKLKLLVW